MPWIINLLVWISNANMGDGNDDGNDDDDDDDEVVNKS